MDFTALVTGSAQAGHSSPVSKPGIGLTAGAGASPTCDAPGGGGGDFASLVELALGQLGAETAEGSATGTAGSTTRSTDDEGEEVAVEAAASALDAPVDAATLAVLIALATPPVAVAVPQPEAAPQADAAGQAGADLAAIDGAPAGTSITAAETALGGAPQRAVSAPGAPDDFQNILATAERTAAPTATSAAVPAAAPASAAPAPGAPAVASVAAPEAQAPGTAAAAAAPATAPAPTAVAAPAAPAAQAAQAAAAPHATARPSNHPLRQALAAMAADAAAPASTPAAQPASSPAAALTSPYGVAQAVPVTAEAPASSPTHEPRSLAAAPVDAPGFAAVASGVQSDTGATGNGSSHGSQDGSEASFRGAEARLDAAVFAAAPSAPAGISPEVLASSALTAVTGFGGVSSGESALRAIDLPAAARFEQAMSSLDPDVRNLQAMVRTVRLFTAGSGATEARLTLEPEHLGPVALTVRIDQGSVSAHFRAETPAAHRWIETHQQELRSGLREQGLDVKEVVVTTDPDGRRERQQYEAPVKPRARRQPAADAPRFEVLA